MAVACEPTGARWLQVQRLCAGRGLPLVCIQPLVSHIARQQQDYTTHKTDEADCVLIARLACELHCYIPEELDEAWAQLRHLGWRRAVRGALAGWGGQRVAGQVCRAVFAALTDTEGVIITHRRGLRRRCAGELGDLQRVRAQLVPVA